MKKKALSPVERFLALSDAEKDAEVAQYEREIPLSETRPLTRAERKKWESIQRELKRKHRERQRGRPTLGNGAKIVSVSIEEKLLRRADRFAKSHAMKRSQMIAQGLQLVMQRAG